MVDIYTSESEQIEQLKKLWREYGIAIVIGVIIALLLGFGWRAYQYRHEHTLAHASMRYEQLLTNVVNGNTDAVEAGANRLMARYPKTPYAGFAALQLARQDVYQNKLGEAEDKLKWVIKNGDNTTLRTLAQLRLTRVYLTDNKPQQALDLLEQLDDKSFSPAAYEIKGDVLVALGKKAEAKQSYENALKSFQGFEVIQPILQMKLEDLAESTDSGA